jgi:hypothetical protein
MFDIQILRFYVVRIFENFSSSYGCIDWVGYGGNK